MFILRILLKAALLPVVLILLLLKVIVKVGIQISSVVLSGLILFVAGSLLYDHKTGLEPDFSAGPDRSRCHGHYDRRRHYRELGRRSTDGNCRHLNILNCFLYVINAY